MTCKSSIRLAITTATWWQDLQSSLSGSNGFNKCILRTSIVQVIWCYVSHIEMYLVSNNNYVNGIKIQQVFLLKKKFNKCETCQ